MSFAALLAFWGVSALFVITPGADWAYAITAGLNRRVLPAVVGLLTGHLVATLIVAAGVGAIVMSIPGALTVLTIVGSLYLIWLGISTLRHPSVVRPSDDAASGSAWRWWLKGFGVSGLNPKVFLLFLAVLPPFTDADAPWPLAVQITVLGLVHIVSCAAMYLAVGYGANRILHSRPTAARVVSRVSGVAMIAIGLFLVIERLLHP
ncbi:MULTISPECIES: LysE family translocator [unclassified Microbacterium]|uniref:LysE family translocator n=1 Tax=unclassified Microbacterium TaxID=2609290 RepID=UPI000D5077E4|nr:LysE family translocator [Microbacterium sp. TPD7012]PVE98296.1 lysine transporter LysE [Microbacterium sp. TPD7012]